MNSPLGAQRLSASADTDSSRKSNLDPDILNGSDMLTYLDNAENQPPIDYSLNAEVPQGDRRLYVNEVIIDAYTTSHETQTTVHQPVSTRLAKTWLLDPAIASHSGMLVEVCGSNQLLSGIAWHGGDYECARGVVLSVHNTGATEENFPSTARVKFRSPLNPSIDTFAVPVSLLRPVRPDAVGQDALIVGGQCKGHMARLLEEVSDGWFVAAAYDYFEVPGEDLVRLFATDT